MSYFADVHAHLTHEHFHSDLPEVIARAALAGLGAIVVNGLNPRSNDAVLQMAQQYPIVKAAWGIYPVDAVHPSLAADFAISVEPFSVDDEIARIKDAAERNIIAAVGETGLDGYWLGSDTFAEQDRVFAALAEIAREANIPLIVHSRKREARAIALLSELKLQKVIFHCFEGGTKLAVPAAEKHGWTFSIPANSLRHQGFQKMLSELPWESILTETDCPYLAPIPKTRNEPANVVGTVELLAQLRAKSREECREKIWQNYTRLFS